MMIQTRILDLPVGVSSFVLVDDGVYTIVLNARLSAEDRARHYRHELGHIQNCDFEKEMTADVIEYYAHGGTP